MKHYDVQQPVHNGPVRIRFWHGEGHRVEPVVSVAGDHVANLCTDCDVVLPFNHDCQDCEFVEITRLCDTDPDYVLARACSKHNQGAR